MSKKINCYNFNFYNNTDRFYFNNLNYHLNISNCYKPILPEVERQNFEIDIENINKIAIKDRTTEETKKFEIAEIPTEFKEIVEKRFEIYNNLYKKN
jgi:hypothetical protein